MENQSQSELLDLMILDIKLNQRQNLHDMKSQFEHVIETMKPINILTETMAEVRNSSAIKQNLLTTAVTVAAGFVSNQLIMGQSVNVFRKLGGYHLQFAASKIKFNNKMQVQ